jgi:hypothetical protein
MNKYILYIIFTSVSFKSFSQDLGLKNNTYFFLGLGLPFVKVRDMANSPQTYTGVVPTLRLGYESNNSDRVLRAFVSASFGSTSPKSKPKTDRIISNMDFSNLQVNFAYYKSLNRNSTEGVNAYLGGGLSLYLDMREYNLPSNNIIGYMVNSSLNIGSFLQRNVDDKWHFNYEGFFPILSHSMRPNYIGMLPMKGEDFSPKKVLSTGSFVTLNKYFRFYNRFSFDQKIKDYRSRRLFYIWDFNWNSVSKTVKSIVGGVGYESLFKM